MSPSPSDSDDHVIGEALEALSSIPTARFLLISRCGDRRMGRLVEWVQQCGTTPPMVMLALPKGDPISPIIRDSRGFALGMLSEGDGLLPKLFGEVDGDGDPFLGLPLAETESGMPIPQRCPIRLECEMVRHLDIDSDCELYVGAVKWSAIAVPAAPPARRRSLTRPEREEPKGPQATREGPATPRSRSRRA